VGFKINETALKSSQHKKSEGNPAETRRLWRKGFVWQVMDRYRYMKSV